ncbi:hypothetical protein F5Y12DRAFT_786101 [Xylaria sp. FL1777]|nr:hypothetical protein F5Y12DRAFT_786101 [Xylaria sp. FL1777]
MKEMEEQFNFKATYQLGVKWSWKKYNQGKMKLSKHRSRKLPPRDDLSDSNSEDSRVVANEFEVPGRDIASLRTPLSNLFTSQRLDEESLNMLRGSDISALSQCLRLCFHWCDEEIQTDEAQLPLPYGDAADEELDNSDSKYELDVRIFIYLLDRYIGSLSSSPEHDNWDDIAKGVIGFCPIKMLFTMSTLIVVIVSNALRQCQEEIAFEPPHVFDVAKLGISEVSRNAWNDEKLVTEFCAEFETILKDYSNYGNAISSAVSMYITQNWSETEANEDLELVDGDLWPPMWPGNIRDEGMYSIDNGQWMG